MDQTEQKTCKNRRNLYFAISETRDFKEVIFKGYVGFLDLTEDNDYTVKGGFI